MEDAFRKAGMNLNVIEISDAEIYDLYKAPLVLVRPDQIVAWRGQAAHDASGIVARILGHACSKPRSEALERPW
jgi:hypothetical protein